MAQAARSLGLPLDDDERLRVGKYLASHPDLSPVLQRWETPAFVLTEEEKLLGRTLQLSGRPLTVTEIADRSGIGSRAVDTGLRTLVGLGLALPQGSGYRLAPDWGNRLGPLGWTFHTVSPHRGRLLQVPCAVDFLLLAAGAYRDHELVIEDSCAHCTDPIRVVIHPRLRVEVESARDRDPGRVWLRRECSLPVGRAPGQLAGRARDSEPWRQQEE